MFLPARSISKIGSPGVLWVTSLIIGMLLAGAVTVTAQDDSSFPFQNPNLPIAQRVDDLVSRMTLQEKVSQMTDGAPAIPRLGIPAYEWWSEGLHGLWNTPTTVFPEPIGLAATFDLSLEKQIGDAISDEGRAWYNRANQGAVDQGHAHGLTFFAPNINIFRDPRWGRGQETYGEDPFLTGRFGTVYVQEMLGTDPKYFKLIATPKHYAVHSGPEIGRHKFNANPSLYDLNDTYLPAFEACVREGHAQSVMTAYNAIYGIPDSVSPLLIQQKLRKEWGFDGYVISDKGAIADIFNGDGTSGHFYTKSMAEAAADAVNAGCDLTFDHNYDSLPDAINQGLITEDQINVSVKRIFTARMKLGMFDPPDMVPYNKIPDSVIDSPEHREIALRAARESIVLLKNEGNVLPLKPNVRSILVIGPNADNVHTQVGNYAGTSSKEVSALEGIRQRAESNGVAVDYLKGCELQGGDAAKVSPIPSSALSSNGKPGLKGEYFSNVNLDGAPANIQQDDTVEFNWSDTPPTGMDHDNYSARWTGTLTAPADGDYLLSVHGDDGFRLFVNQEKVIDDWTPHADEAKSYAITLKTGQSVPIEIDYFQGTGNALIGLDWQLPSDSPFADQVAAAKRADAVIFVGGISSMFEGEESMGGDRSTLDLPDVQERLLQALNTSGKPVVLVLMNGSAMSVNWAQAHIPAIVETWYSGEEGGNALADVLFGNYNPAGRLPVTFYKGLDQLPDFTDYSMKSRTYRYFSGSPLYPFGYGLSYTKFAYSGIQAPATIARGQPVTVQATVQNTGKVAGDEVAELYLRPAPNAPVRQIAPDQPMPRVVLGGFQRVSLTPGASTVIKFLLKPEQLLLVNAQGKRALQPGTWQIFVGGGQPDISGATTVPGANVTSLLTVH